ncbi:hypothetical protein [Tenacibaculum amylolyticum]|uniref:hypothetical protein n=1 Tax=Tenacibaculum amylolyticum TaxID=104269 RepID=UPI0038947EAB
MKNRKILKIVLYSIGILLLFFARFFYLSNPKYVPSKNKFTERVAYIDSEKALLSEGFETCSTIMFDYYNPERATYSEGKNGLRKFILSNYKNKSYNESGYLHIRFIINCKGEAGCYIIHENNLNLEPKEFNKDLVDQLFKLTTQLKKWNPNVVSGKKRDSYMYISYKIENGNITEIIP